METGIIPFNYGPYFEIILLFGFFVLGVYFAPLAELLKVELAVDTLLALAILTRPIINTLALGTG